MYFAVIEKKTRTRFYFAGYDTSKREACVVGLNQNFKQ